MSLTFDETFPVAFAAPVVWTRLQDIEFVARCFPGATLDEQLDDGSYAGRLAMKLGPTRAQFSGTLALDLDDDRRTAHLTAKGGDGRRSQAAANGTIHVADTTDATSTLHLDVAIDVAGPLGQFARSGGRELTRQLLDDFVAAVEQELADEQTPASAPASVPAPAPLVPAPTPADTSAHAPATTRRAELDAGSLLWRSLRATLARWLRSLGDRWRTRRKARS